MPMPSLLVTDNGVGASVRTFVELQNAQQTHSQFYTRSNTPELTTRQRKRRHTLLKKRRKTVLPCTVKSTVSLTVHGRFGSNHYSKMAVWVWVRVRFRVSVRIRIKVMVRVRVIRFIQVNSCTHCHGHAAATTSHSYFGILVWSKSTVGAIVVR